MQSSISKKKWLSVAGILALCSFAMAQAPETIGSAEIYLRMKKLNVLGSVLYVAAHPDDENSRLIAYMSKDRLYRTGYLSMTRGDGGQNLIGDEQGIELGLIRTQEMLAARRVDGADQFFTRAFDFGFSKSTDEALKTWNKEKILSDVVWVIRKFQPDVIMTRFPEDARAGHGHHSASAVLAHEAFTAAADPNRFPEQFKYGVKPWQAKRIFWNTFNFGGNYNTTSEDQVKVDMGVYNPVLGKSYGELAAESRTNHKSQGAALTPARGQSIEYFSLVAGAPVHADPMDDVTTTWERVPGGGKIRDMVDQLIKEYSLSDPAASVPALVTLYKAIAALPEGYWRTRKMQETQKLIEACSGLWLEASVRSGYVAQGDSLTISFVLNNRLNTKAVVNGISVSGTSANGASANGASANGASANAFDTTWRQELAGNKNFSFVKNIGIAANYPVTQPYWLVEPMSPGSFNVSDQRLIGNAQSMPSIEARFRITIDGQDFVFTRPVLNKYTDPVKGELYQPLTVLPPVTGRFAPSLVLFTDGEKKDFEVQTQVRTNRPVSPTLALTGAEGISWSQDGNAYGNYQYTVTPGKTGSDVVNARLLLGTNGASGMNGKAGKPDSALDLRTIAYDHIPRIDYFRPAVEKFVKADVKIAGRRIGYIEGAGDKVPAALQQMGYEVTLLGEKDITAATLSQYDAVIAGVRAYDVHDWLIGKYDLLMGYVKDGGNLVVQYNRNFIGNAKAKIGPYPFAISGGRVTDENATVNFLLPEHRVLNYPNKITAHDFDGWIQERGIYFAGQMDPAYEAVFSMQDPGEAAQNGSLVIATYGKGKFVYTGLVFFRELPAGVPGAYRLMANIIALNQKKAF